MTTYILCKDLSHDTEGEDLYQVMGWGQENLRISQERGGEPVTFTVFDDQDKAIAVFTNRRINCTFVKEAWSGRKGDDVVTVGSLTFDATDAILSLSLEEIHALNDNDTSSDAIGQQHVDWEGPHRVYVVEAIQEFFGVPGLMAISESALNHARECFKPRPIIEDKVTLTIEVSVYMKEPEDEQERAKALTDFTENLDYSITSNTVGASVKSTTITEWSAPDSLGDPEVSQLRHRE